MIVYGCSYEAPGSSEYDTVIAENEAMALEIMKERHGQRVECEFHATSFEKVTVSQLTAGDLVRLLDMRAHRGL